MGKGNFNKFQYIERNRILFIRLRLHCRLKMVCLRNTRLHINGVKEKEETSNFCDLNSIRKKIGLRSTNIIRVLKVWGETTCTL